jgi:N,N'-diacetylbacillosaminyl-diphospho-undecaprenol alpha-1,3-N-acetylgalactosaminyltransferase
MNRFIDPADDLKFLVELYKIFRNEKFDLIHNFTIKPNIYGAIAGRLARTKRIVALVAGLGYAFLDGRGLKSRLIKLIALLAYKVGFKLTDKVWFQNSDDLELLVSKGAVEREKTVLIKGSGVDLHEFSMESVNLNDLAKLKQELGLTKDSQVVVMSARAQRSKGVLEFIEASSLVAQRNPDCIFLLMGVLAGNSPEAIPKEYLGEKESSYFRWLGFREDAREVLALADVVCLPSYYREGIPRSLLEALALGKPIVTTASVGCQETVDNNKNGFLVPVRDAQALAQAISKLLDDVELRQKFGHYSRLKAESEFDERLVVKRVIVELYGLPPSSLS